MKIVINNSATITTKHIKKAYTYKDTTVLNLDIEYPSITLPKDSVVSKRINTIYTLKANEFYSHVTREILPAAKSDFDYAQANSYPFNPYEAMMRYTVTLNDNCTLSTYTDQYEYTGGAHGNTIRTSNNWNLRNGKQIRLRDLFLHNLNYKEMLLKKIKDQAAQNLADNPGIYFDNYKELIVQNFNPDSFYLTEEALNIYYQQYEIAPYSTGIVVFSLPYKEIGLKRPNCKTKYNLVL